MAEDNKQAIRVGFIGLGKGRDASPVRKTFRLWSNWERRLLTVLVKHLAMSM